MFAEIRKFVVAALGLAAEAVNAGLVTGTAAKWAAVVIAAITATGVFVVPNQAPVPSKQTTPAP